MDCLEQTDRCRLVFDHVPSRMKHAAIELWEAVQYAEQTSGNYWDFAVEIRRLTDGYRLNLNDIRWLIRMGLVDHQHEVVAKKGTSRAFTRKGPLPFSDRSCFVLTDRGILFAQQSCGTASRDTWIDDARYGEPSSSDEGHVAMLTPSAVDLRGAEGPSRQPRWDAQRRVLSLAGTLVKRFKWAAENQEAVLSAFEEERWPPRIDDPLVPQQDQDPKRRLSDTIKSLNRNQRCRRIHFRGDGTGEGVVWEYAGP